MNSILYTVVSVTAIVLVASPASYVLSRYRFRGNTIISAMFAAALGIPIIMIIMPLFGLAASMRLIGNRWVLIALYIGMNVPFSVFFLFAFFKNLSTSYEESAAMDGCSPVKTFWMIMFPLVQPGLITLTVFNSVTIWNEFFVALIFANQPAVRPASVGLFNLYQAMRYTGDWGGMFAGLIIILLPTILLYIFLSERIIKGVTAGAIKG
jgi:N-acetylglucosamine transport system permease protein